MALKRDDLGAGCEERLFNVVQLLPGDENLLLQEFLIGLLERFRGNDLRMNRFAQPMDGFEIAEGDVGVARALRGGVQCAFCVLGDDPSRFHF